MTLFTTPLMKGDENHGMVYVLKFTVNDLKETVLRLDLKQPLIFFFFETFYNLFNDMNKSLYLKEDNKMKNIFKLFVAISCITMFVAGNFMTAQMLWEETELYYTTSLRVDNLASLGICILLIFAECILSWGAITIIEATMSDKMKRIIAIIREK